MIRAARLLRAFARPSRNVEETDIRVPSSDGERPATLLRPLRAARGPTWIVLQGLTVFGRQHPTLTRFARALCSSGSTVIVPEIPSWTALRMCTDAAAAAATDAADYLKCQLGSDEAVGLIGFSFGATQGLVAAAEPATRHRIRTVVGFGAYCEMHRFARFMMTGEHEWKGERFRLDPDPYARWIVAANYLTAVPGLQRMGRVQQYAWKLALEAGRGGLEAPDRFVDPLKIRLRAELDPEEREVWDLVAPPAGTLPRDRAAAIGLGAALADAALAAAPRLDPRRAFSYLRARLVLAHGRSDRLIPFTETLRLAEALPTHLRSRTAITRLFEHSVRATGLRHRERAVEAWRLLRLLHTALRT